MSEASVGRSDCVAHRPADRSSQDAGAWPAQEHAEEVYSDTCCPNDMCIQEHRADAGHSAVAYQRLCAQSNAVDMATSAGPVTEGLELTKRSRVSVRSSKHVLTAYSDEYLNQLCSPSLMDKHGSSLNPLALSLTSFIVFRR